MSLNGDITEAAMTRLAQLEVNDKIHRGSVQTDIAELAHAIRKHTTELFGELRRFWERNMGDGLASERGWEEEEEVQGKTGHCNS